jgi:hypothetical protein
VTAGDGASLIPRSGKQGELITGFAHGQHYEAAVRGNIYCGGMKALTSLAASTFVIGDLSATATPIIGLWNRSTSLYNLVILYATLSCSAPAATVEGIGGFAWCTSTGNAALTLGVAPFNQKTFAAAGSSAVDVSTTALTGLTNALVVRRASTMHGSAHGTYSMIGSAVGFHVPTPAQIEYFDGSLIVPPGGVLALLGMELPVAQTAISGIVWEEVLA